MPRQKFGSRQTNGSGRGGGRGSGRGAGRGGGGRSGGGRGGGGRGGGGSNNKFGKRPKRPEIDKAGRKYRFMQQNQENEETLRRQQDLEKRYRERNADTNQMSDDEMASSSEDENNAGGLDELISTFKSDPETVDDAIESEDDDVEGEEEGTEEEGTDEEEDDEDDIADDIDDDDDDDDDDSGDDVFPEKFEEQSQPRGRKYRSSDEENGESDENDEDSDDLPEDTEQILLRPEEFDTGKHQFDDTIEDDGESDEEPVDDEEDDDDDDDDDAEATEDEDVENENETPSNDDKFDSHYGADLSTKMLDSMNTTHLTKKEILNWSILGRIQVEIPTADDANSNNGNGKKTKLTLLDDDEEYAPEGTVPTVSAEADIDLEQAGIKVQLRPHVIAANKANVKGDGSNFTPLQRELFAVMNNYQDLFYAQRNHLNGEEIRFMYSLHALNHIMKTRTKVMNHNLKLKMSGDPKSSAIIPDKYRDQGLFRSKVLIVVPFRESALRIVNNIVNLVFPNADKEAASSNQQVMHYKRFLTEYGGESLHFPKRNPKPEDYEQTFAGNSDDTFRIGLKFTRKAIKLYSDFYSSDILIVSPVGLRMVVGAPGDKERDYDFLASIEMLILDQADIFLAQNWDHLLHVLDHLHLQPQSARNTDFSRVRSWCLNGWSRFYRQTLLFASHELAEFRSLFNSRCSNYRGKVRLMNPIVNGTMKHVAVHVTQTFHRIDVVSIQSSFDQRFDYFINTILPQFKAASKAHCVVFIPSYFDFVRVRNHFKGETMNFVQICEYTKDTKIDRARSMFFHSGAHFMLYSERAHFFRRTRLKGIRHLIMYQPPTWPHFYAEMINLMQEANQNPRDGIDNAMSVTVLYTKYDMLQIASVVGTKQANEMAQSTKSTHIFMTGE